MLDSLIQVSDPRKSKNVPHVDRVTVHIAGKSTSELERDTCKAICNSVRLFLVLSEVFENEFRT